MSENPIKRQPRAQVPAELKCKEIGISIPAATYIKALAEAKRQNKSFSLWMAEAASAKLETEMVS